MTANIAFTSLDINLNNSQCLLKNSIAFNKMRQDFYFIQEKDILNNVLTIVTFVTFSSIQLTFHIFVYPEIIGREI